MMDWQRLIESIGPCEVHVSSSPSGITEPDITVHVREDSEQLFLLYTGQAQKLMMAPDTFCRAAGLLAHNVVILRDPYMAFYESGISDSINSFEAMLDWESSLVRQLAHVRRTHCVGTSMGTYAALRHGHRLRVETVWAFSPKTLIPQEPEHDADAAHADLKQELERGNGITAYYIYYNERFARDREQALRIESCEGVVLRPQDGDGENVVATLAAAGVLANVFRAPDETPAPAAS